MTADQNAESVNLPVSGAKEDLLDAKGLCSNNDNSKDSTKEAKLPTKVSVKIEPYTERLGSHKIRDMNNIRGNTCA